MKMKCLVVLLVCLMTGSLFAATTGVWNKDTDACGITGAWNNQWMWQANVVPPATTLTGDEIKVQTIGAGVVIDGFTADYYQRLTLGSTSSAGPAVITIQETDFETPTSFGMGEFRVGTNMNANAIDNYAEVYQTGGTLTVNDLFLSRSKSVPVGSNVHGFYKISGGTLQARAGILATMGRITVASFAETLGTAGISTFVVDGDAAVINMNHLLVGSQASTFAGIGDGTLQYTLTASGTVSKITVVDTKLDQVAASSTKLVIDDAAVATATLDVILLVENTGTALVLGDFDTINGIDGAEGALVDVAGITYVLTYLYAAGTDLIGNDIALLIPEPATIALLSIGLLAIRRNRK